MGSQYAYTAINAVLDYLKAEIPGRITATQTTLNMGKSKSDTDYLDIPNDVTQYAIGELWEKKTPFHLFVYTDSVAPNSPSGQRNRLATIGLFVGVRIKGSGDMARDSLKAYIYGDTIIDAIEDDATLGDRAQACLYESVDFGPLPEGDLSENAFGCLVKLTVRLQGDRS